MPDTTVRIPDWANPQNASVLDNWFTRALRAAGGVMGAADPTAQAMALGAPVELPGGEAGPAQKLTQRMLKAYHGSPNEFSQFDFGRAGSVTDAGYLGDKAAYFSTDKNVAGHFPHQYTADLGVSKPLRVSFDSWGADKAGLVRKALKLPDSATYSDIRQAVLQGGHDSVVLDYSPVGYHHQEIAVFSPQQIQGFQRLGK